MALVLLGAYSLVRQLSIKLRKDTGMENVSSNHGNLFQVGDLVIVFMMIQNSGACMQTSLVVQEGNMDPYVILTSHTQEQTSNVASGPIIDTVVMNPPFKTWKKGADMDFLFATLKTRNATGLVAPTIATGLGALTHTLGTLVPVIGASGFATAAAVTVIGTIVGSFR